MKRSKHLHEEEMQEHLHSQERAYLNAERELEEQQMMQQVFEEEMREKESLKTPTIVLGKGRKASKFATYGRKGRVLLKRYLQYIFGKV